MNENIGGGSLRLNSQEAEDAMDRVVTTQSFNFLKMQERLKNIIKCQNSLKASQIQAEREFCEASRSQTGEIFLDDDDQLKEKETKLREERDQLHKALIKHQSLTSAFQGAVFQTQIQKSFHECLNEVNEDPMKEEVRTVLENYSENLSVSSELSKAVKRTEDLEREILHLRLKYRILLESLEQKWKTLKEMKAQGPRYNYPSDNPELKELEGKLTKRQERLDLLITLLQHLISCSGEKWGANARIVEIMLLCDGAPTQVDRSEDVSEAIKRMQEARENAGKKTPMEIFVSSTPK